MAATTPPADQKVAGRARPSCEERLAIFLKLGGRLNQTASIHQAAQTILQAADELTGWDAASFDLYSAESEAVMCALAMDIVDGVRSDVTPEEYHLVPTTKFRDVCANGPELVNRDLSPSHTSDLSAFGDKSRPSASLIFVPVRCNPRVRGVLTIQSYTPNAYNQDDLDTLTTLGDLAAGAIDRLQVDALLRRTEELYRRAIGAAGAVPYVYDYRNQVYTFMGEGVKRLIGYAPQEVNGKLWSRIIREATMSGEAAGLTKEEAARRVKIGELERWQCDMRVSTHEGKNCWIADSSVQNYDESGTVIGSMGILQDITERKHAELSALALSKLGQNLISATTAREVATLIGEAADQLFGWDACAFYLYSEERDEIEPVRYMDTVDGRRIEVPPPDSLHQPGRINRRVIKQGAELTLRDPSQLKADPEARPFGDVTRPSASIMRVPIRLRERKVTGVVSFQSYTSYAYTRKDLGTLQALADCCGVALERIWSDDALRQSESQFRLLWESSEDGMRLTNRDGMVLRVNNAFCRMARKPRQELEGKSLTVIHAADKGKFILGAYQRRLDSKTIKTQLEEEVTLWNGDKVWFELSNSLLEVAGRPPLVLSIFRDITRRKEAEAELDRMHRQLVTVSRQAGMAEVATSVLHNVGNVLNSVNVSNSVIEDKIRKSKTANVSRVAGLLQEHAADLAKFLTEDSKGRQLPAYLSGLADVLRREQKELLEEVDSLGDNIDHIKEIVVMQQNYAKVLGLLELHSASGLVEDALRLNAGAMERHRVEVIRNYEELPPILVDKHAVLQILVNLIRNAKYALDDKGHTDKKMTLRVGLNGDKMVRISVIDNGIGIPRENLTRIFEHGFTTRKEGHGFGLHNGALAARQLGGSLTVHSDGPGTGAAFTLELPQRPKDSDHNTNFLDKQA